MELRRRVRAELEREVVQVLPVVQEVAPDLVTLVAEAQDEATEAEVTVRLHDVPQDRLAADVDERLGQLLAGLAQPGAHAAAQDDDGDVRRVVVDLLSRVLHGRFLPSGCALVSSPLVATNPAW